MSDSTSTRADTPSEHFVRQIIREDLEKGRHKTVVTRFPPEPNGYLHIGHAKSIALNFGMAKEFGGRCHLRFDDTNPEAEDEEYARSIQEDIRWLGYDWGDNLFYASDYYEQLYTFAEELIRKGLAYVCHLSEEDTRAYRGTVYEAGRHSPHRERSVEENLALFNTMRMGGFADGACTLKAKIDMASPNMKMRDPPLYRIRRHTHYRTGDAWCLYPLYDFAHCLSDAIEGITHSVCTLEFENNRELYDWLVDKIDVPAQPHQYEFARLNINYTIMSKRRLLRLVKEGHVSGWDDPRMLTISGMRRRGITPEAIRTFCEQIGVAKTNSTVEMGRLEATVRDDLERRSPRAIAVLDPVELLIETLPEGSVETFEAPMWPEGSEHKGSRALPFGRRLFIERDDFAQEPPAGWKRLAPGWEVRLRHAYFVKCERVETDDEGRLTRIICSHDPATRGGTSPDGRKPKGTLHWVSAEHADQAEVRVFNRLFSVERPGAIEGRDFVEDLAPDSLVVYPQARVEPAIANADGGARYQFERLGYFFVDPVERSAGHLVFNRTESLRASKTGGRKAASATPKKSDGGRPPTIEERLAKLDDAVRTEVTNLATDRALKAADALVLVENPPLRALFNDAVDAGAKAATAANWLIHELSRVLREAGLDAPKTDGKALAELIKLLEDGVVSSTAAKTVFEAMIVAGESPSEVVEREGLRQVNDDAALEAIVDGVLAEHPTEAARYAGGEKKLTGFFLGRIMKASGGKANPKAVRTILERKTS